MGEKVETDSVKNAITYILISPPVHLKLLAFTSSIRATCKSGTDRGKTNMKKEELKNRLVESFNKLEIKECEVCGRFISKKEFEQGEGACFKCWDTPEKLT